MMDSERHHAPASGELLAASEGGEEASSLLGSNRELAILYTIAGQLNRKVNVREALQEVLSQVTRLLGLKTGWVWLLDEEGKPFLAASQSLPPYLADHPERMTGRCLCLDTFLGGSLARAANINVLRCSRLHNAEREGDPSSWGLRFHASVPIHVGETPLGVLNVASEDWRELHSAELQLLHIIGDQIGLAIQRARLSAEHTRAAARLAAIEERNRLAREIHDTLAQGLAAIALQLETADALLPTQPERAQAAVRRALALARSNLEEARRSVMDLRAAPLQNHALPEALALLIKRLRVENRSRLEYRYEPPPGPGPGGEPGRFPALSPHCEAGLYRIAQEALNNALRHAAAEQITLTLAVRDKMIVLQVQDNGRGFDPERAQEYTRAGHFGLAGMSERAHLLGAQISIESLPGSGTSISVYLPYQGQEQERSPWL
ncbi:GAF domain-containing sensor histidine kinase [Thermogemmatispora carboxidivorans]|uniref:GAF domain-containing sensor histidine kinase n=1 Tax=Thermogemmatispora carboxidivorans TaxID=1382306 RepID=UPI0009E0153A|nr:GAF domain-containing sensor histidine kinase [Thermogemmatispora carboxidivorans]